MMVAMFDCTPMTSYPQPIYYTNDNNGMQETPLRTSIPRNFSGNNHSSDDESMQEYPQRTSNPRNYYGDYINDNKGMLEHPQPTCVLRDMSGNTRSTPENTYSPAAMMLEDSKFLPVYFSDQTNSVYPDPSTSRRSSNTNQNAYASAFLTTSVNPSSVLSPWTLQNPSHNMDYLSYAPVWPTSLPFHDYCPCDQHVPVQLPELGYESASPASDHATYSRMTLSQSPVIKTEHDEDSDPFDQTPADEEDTDNVDPCYAELLRQCLLKAPDYTMSLRDLYAWVAEHSPKAKDPTSTGWKNSVRHNLSMNQGFEKVPDMNPRPAGSKLRSLWRLTEDAVLRGIQSTTRYRKGDSKRKAQRSNRGSPDNKRVKSGAKGGQATRRLANRRAMAAARSSCNSSAPPQLHFQSQSYPIRVQPSAQVISPPNIMYSMPNSSGYWEGMSSAHDQVSYTSPMSCKIEDNVDGYLFPSPETQGWDW